MTDGPPDFRVYSLQETLAKLGLPQQDKYSISDAAKILGVSLRTVQRWIGNGELPVISVSSKKRWVLADDLEKMIQYSQIESVSNNPEFIEALSGKIKFDHCTACNAPADLWLFVEIGGVLADAVLNIREKRFQNIAFALYRWLHFPGLWVNCFSGKDYNASTRECESCGVSSSWQGILNDCRILSESICLKRSTAKRFHAAHELLKYLARMHQE